MAITLQESWNYPENTELQNIAGWTTTGAFEADKSGIKVATNGNLKTSATNGSLAYINAGNTDHYASYVIADIDNGAIIYNGCAIRCESASLFIGVRSFQGAISVYYRGGGNFNSLATAYTPPSGQQLGDVVKIGVEGELLTLYYNDVEVATKDLTGIPISRTATNVGLYSKGTINPSIGAMEFGTNAENTLLIDDPAHEIIAVNGNSAQYTISGTYDSVVVPTAIEYRVVDFFTASVIEDWALLDAAPSAGTYSATVTMTKGFFRQIQTRFANDTSIVGLSSKVGFGYLGEFGGQSNTVNQFTTGETEPANNQTAIFNGVSTWSTPTNERIINALNAISAANQCVVGCFVTAVNGSDIDQHLPGGTNYANRVDALTNAGGVINFNWWGQGESQTGTSGYAAKLGEYRADLLSRTGQASADLPMFIVQLGRTSTSGSDAIWNATRTDQTIFANATDDVYISHQTMDLPLSDGLHRNGSGLKQGALRFSETFNSVSLGSGTNGRGAYVQSIVLTGNQVEITYNLNGGTSLTLPVGVENSYTVTDIDAASTVAVTSASVSGNVITLTLASAPTGEVSIVSGQGKNPDTTIMPTSDKIYDGQAAIVEPMVLPVISSAGVSSTLNLTVTGAANDTLTIHFFNRADNTFIKSEAVAFVSDVASVNFSLSAGAIIGGFYDGVNPPTTGTGIYGVTV